MDITEDDSMTPSVLQIMLSPFKPYIESTSRKPRKSPNMAKQVFERFNGTELTDRMLEEAAQLFNENYGIWGEDPANPGPHPNQVSWVHLP